MKTRWEFHFKARDFKFDRVYKFKATADLRSPDGDPPPDFAKQSFVEIIPDEKSIRAEAEQTGRINLYLRGTPDETQDFAYWFVDKFAKQIAFKHGDFRIDGGLITFERLPETDEERAAIGDKPFGAHLSLQEVPETPVFSADSLGKMTSNPLYDRGVAQYNAACRAHTEIDRYLGFFKVLELVYSESGGNAKLEHALCQSPKFRAALEACTTSSNGQPLSADDVRSITRKLLRVRHECAHLRQRQGIAPGNSPEVDEVSAYADLVDCLSRVTLEGLNSDDADSEMAGGA